jgi:pyruvate dehydrogenase E1 component alpha subunit
MNLAAVWRLPVIFVCENNLYGEYSPILTTTPFEDLTRRADAYAMPAEVVDGNDVVLVHDCAQRAVARARAGEGPTFIECKTYRTRGHSRSDPGKYRPPGELDAWLARDPIKLCERRMLSEGRLGEAELAQVRDKVDRELDAALQAAADAPFPAERPLFHETLLGGRPHG